MAEDDGDGARRRHGEIGEQRHPRGRDMDEHDPDRLALLVILRRGDEAQIEAGGQQDCGERPGPGLDQGEEAEEAARIGELLHGVI